MSRVRSSVTFTLLLAVLAGAGWLLSLAGERSSLILLGIWIVGAPVAVGWDLRTLRRRVEALERRWADDDRAAGAAGVADLGDLRNPSPDQLARAVGQPAR